MEWHVLIRHTEASCKFTAVSSLSDLFSPSHRPWLEAYDVLHSVMTPLACLRIYSMTRVVPTRPQADVMHGGLDVLSEQYSQRCLQLSSSQQNSKSTETMLGYKERELEQLRRENQVSCTYTLLIMSPVSAGQHISSGNTLSRS